MSNIRQEIEKVNNMDRSTLIKDKDQVGVVCKPEDQFRIILGYIAQNKKVENLIKRYWGILQKD